MTYEHGDVLVVPFPFIDIARTKHRPAVVFSNADYNAATASLMCVMITSAASSRWPLDVSITDLQSAGLSTPCSVRMKLFTLDTRVVVARLGVLSPFDKEQVVESLQELMNLPAAPRSRG